MNIKHCDSWPVGSLMLYDNHPKDLRPYRQSSFYHVDIGLIVTNDGDFTVMVMWGTKSKKRILSYDVRTLNPVVISHVL